MRALARTRFAPVISARLRGVLRVRSPRPGFRRLLRPTAGTFERRDGVNGDGVACYQVASRRLPIPHLTEVIDDWVQVHGLAPRALPRLRRSSSAALRNRRQETEFREEELVHLFRYCDSRPVRVGNEIYDQLQLGLYGAVLDAAYLYNKYGAPLDYEVWQSLRSPMGWLSENWQQPDAGMWGARLS